jgi:hypothetical protein
VVPAALALGLMVAPAAATADTSSATTNQVQAKTAGSDAPPPVLPSIVRTRIERGENAIERAGDWVDQDADDKAVVSLRNARRNMYAAWRGAVDVIENAPPPPPAEAGMVHRKIRVQRQARKSATYTGPDEAAVAVLNLQHDVATAAFGLLDGAKGALRDAVSTTMFAALNRRDQAIVYIHNRPVPPPVAEEGRVRARAAGQEGGPATFATLMPAIVPDLDDELGQTRGLIRAGALTPGEKRIMTLAKSQILETRDQVNTWWPPLPVGDD